jgi:hypothetical protein
MATLLSALDLANHVVEVWDISDFDLRAIPPP